MPKPFNSAQAKLVANFSSDLAKGLLLAGVSMPFISKEYVFYRGVLALSNSLIAIFLLRFAINILKEVKND